MGKCPTSELIKKLKEVRKKKWDTIELNNLRNESQKDNKPECVEEKQSSVKIEGIEEKYYALIEEYNALEEKYTATQEKNTALATELEKMEKDFAELKEK